MKVPAKVCDSVVLSTPQFLAHQLENAENSFAFVSKSGLWLCLVNDLVIGIYCAKSGRWRGGYNFGDSLHDPSTKITVVAELVSAHLDSTCLLVVINQSHETLLCLFDVKSCVVRFSVLVPEVITSLEVVSSVGGASIETHNLNRRLRYMFGVVAVGTSTGSIYLLDLCLDEQLDCDEKLPNITAVVKKRDLSAECREDAISKGQHILLHLNDENIISGCFDMPKGSAYYAKDIVVTALHYVQSLTTLASGFNFGGIQLWDLNDLNLLYTITSATEEPVVNFAFQEPENDPRHFCYLWGVRGHIISENKVPDSLSIATMYSLSYYRKEQVKEFGPLYSELQSCNKRLEFPLKGNNYAAGSSKVIGSSLISCQSVNHKDVTHNLESNLVNESELGCDEQSLCFIAWEVWGETGNLPSYHLAVFDLNQWYQGQMPSTVRLDPSELNSFVGIFSLAEVMQNLKKPIMGLLCYPHTIKKFKSHQNAEEFFYPSSLCFQIMSFSDSNLCKTTYFGLQRYLLCEMAEMGPQALINPHEIYATLHQSGLISDLHGHSDVISVTSQKEVILQLALENNLFIFFTKCLKEWKYGDSIHEFCTSKSLLNWAWKKVITIKTSIDRIGVPLFDCSGNDIDKTSLRTLQSYRKQLGVIESIMNGYQFHAPPRTEQGFQELQFRQDAVCTINQYLQVLLWLRSVQVLPETWYDPDANVSVSYPVEIMTEYYARRRSYIQSLHWSLGAADVLMIDGMVEEAGVGGIWQEKGGSKNYPPPSIYAALSSYLTDVKQVQQKHAIMYYLLLDIAHCCHSDIANEIKKFPSLFTMSETSVKIIDAFWYIDHRSFKSAIQCLLDPTITASDLHPWMHHRIIKSLLISHESQLALRFISHMELPHASLEYMRLCISVFLSCGMVTRAFENQRKNQHLGFKEDLLLHLFQGCQQMQKMTELMHLPLNVAESTALVKFLNESDDPQSHEYLVMYYLQYCDFFEAEKANEKLSRLLSNKSDLNIRERASDRNALVEIFVSAMPETSKRLVQEVKHFPVRLKQNEPPQPLSVCVAAKAKAQKKVTYSNILLSLMDGSSPCIAKLPGKASSKVTYNDIPFLRSTLTPAPEKPVTASSVVSSTKRTLTTPSPTDVSMPPKRSRLLDNAVFKVTPLSNRKMPRHLAGDIATLLQTPPVHRKPRTPGTLKPTPKPASILKKRIDMDFLRAETPPIFSKSDTSDEEVMDMDNKVSSKDAPDTESRQIRFDIPNAHLTTPQEQIVTPRAPLRKSPALVIEKNVLLPKDKQEEKGVVLQGETLSEESHSSLTLDVDSDNEEFYSPCGDAVQPSRPSISFAYPQDPPLDNNGSFLDNTISAIEESADVVDVIASSNSTQQHLSGPADFTFNDPLVCESIPVIETETPIPLIDICDEDELDQYASADIPFEASRSDAMLDRTIRFNVSPFVCAGLAEDSGEDDIQILEAALPESDRGRYSERSFATTSRNESRVESGSKSKGEVSSNVEVHLLSDSDDNPEEVVMIEKSSYAAESAHLIVNSLPEDPDGIFEFSLPHDLLTPADFLGAEQSNSNPPGHGQPSVTSISSHETYDTVMEKAVNLSVMHPEIQKETTLADPQPSLPFAIKSSSDASLSSQKSSRSSRVFAFPKRTTSRSAAYLIGKEVATASAQEVSHIVLADAPPAQSDAQRESLEEKHAEAVGPFIQKKNETLDPSVSETLEEVIRSVPTVAMMTSVCETNVTAESITDNSSVRILMDTSRSMTDIPSKSLESNMSSAEPPPPLTSVRKNKKLRTFVFSKNAQSSDASSLMSDTSGLTVDSVVAGGSSFLSSSIHSDLDVSKTISEPKPKDASRVSKKVKSKSSKSKKASLLHVDETSASKCDDDKSISSSNPVLKGIVADKGNVKKSDPKKVEAKSEDLFKVPQELKGKSSRRTFVFGKKTTPHSTTFESSLILGEDTSGRESLPMMDSSRESFLSSEIIKPHESNISSAKTDVSSLGLSRVFDESMKSEKSMLVEADVSGGSILDSFTRKSSRNSNRKFIFSKTSKKTTQDVRKEIVDMDVETSKSEVFLKSKVSETYEEFSSSLRKSDDGVSSEYKLEKSTQSKKGGAVITIRNPSSAQKSAKKKKEKAKTAGRVFTFAEPTCPASPEILEALSDHTADEPLPPFLFSPPLTRGRLRQSTLIDSSFMSSALESSLRAEPPVDPLLEGIIHERSLGASRKTPKRKTPLKKPPVHAADISFLDSISESPGKNSSMRHSMVLRNRHSP